MFVTYVYSINYGLFTINIHPMEMHTSKDQSADDPDQCAIRVYVRRTENTPQFAGILLALPHAFLQVKSFKNGDGKWHKNGKKKSVSDF